MPTPEQISAHPAALANTHLRQEWSQYAPTVQPANTPTAVLEGAMNALTATLATTRMQKLPTVPVAHQDGLRMTAEQLTVARIALQDITTT